MLQNRILKALESRSDLNQKKLSRIAGVNEPAMSRYLRGLEILNFGAILKIVQFLFPEEEKEIMVQYILTEKSRNARFALEYCALNHLYGLLNHLVKDLSLSSNPVDKEWARMYRLILLDKVEKLPAKELLMQLEVFNPKELEMKTMKEMLKCYIYDNLSDHRSLIIHINNVEQLIEQVKSNPMREFLNIRFALMLYYVHLLKNEIKKARHYLTKVLDQDLIKKIKATAYHNLGHSYMFESYDKSNEYLTMAIKLLTDIKSKAILNLSKRTLLFLRSYWRIDKGFDLDLMEI